MNSLRCLPVLLLAACGGSEPTPASTPAAPVELSQEELNAAEARVLAPSPLELDAVVRKVGLADTLGGLVPARSYDMAADDKGAIAVRTGVMLADTVFAGQSGSTGSLVERAATIRQGMASLDATPQLLGSIDDLVGRLQSGASTRDEILAEMDGLTSGLVPEQGWAPDDRTGPLLQAGVWLESAHLVAAACLAKGDADAATALLRDRELVAYFLRYVKTEGTEHAPSPVVAKVADTLQEMEAITAKDRLDLDDVKRIHDLTGGVLALL